MVDEHIRLPHGCSSLDAALGKTVSYSGRGGIKQAVLVRVDGNFFVSRTDEERALRVHVEAAPASDIVAVSLLPIGNGLLPRIREAHRRAMSSEAARLNKGRRHS